MIILDTNVLSEVVRPLPSPQVLRWLAKHPDAELFLTAITQAEILFGIECLAHGKRRNALQVAIRAVLEEEFEGRILPFDSDAAQVFPQIAAKRRAMGRPISEFDAQIAAIARSRSAAVATGNGDDFANCGVTVLDPWR